MCLAAVTSDSQNLGVYLNVDCQKSTVSCQSAPKKPWGYFKQPVFTNLYLHQRERELKVNTSFDDFICEIYLTDDDEEIEVVQWVTKKNAPIVWFARDGMLARLDESVGKIVEAIAERGMLDNSILVFLSDNGAQTFGLHTNEGSNWPLRGSVCPQLKFTLFEGGVRGTCAIWSPLIQQTGRVSSDLIHISDWLPTLYSAAVTSSKKSSSPSMFVDNRASVLSRLSRKLAACPADGEPRLKPTQQLRLIDTQ
uniref:Sulfatase N-terminal domain-containing protein n=1 Tax=Timema bartmani TaxID=61472 RepID=A0A7R9F927_9NEOP|nr:unnamed protein product [Timema bartmani]